MSQRFNAVFVALLGLASVVLLVGPAAEAQQSAPNPRIALVIGNATYRDAALATTANDAGLIAQTLQAAGFDVVGARDLDGQSLRTALRDFLQKAESAGPDMQAFVYLAGRGVQYNGDNYFVPVDAQINRDADVPIEAIRMSDFSHALATTPGRARIIVLDAARANPYAAQGSPLAPGLALVDPEPGELIAFNAAPSTLAGDEEGPYGVYGKTLAGAIRQGGVDIAQAFDQTRVSVNAETQGALLPWSASRLGGPYYVFEREADAAPAAPPLAQTERRPISSFPAADAYAAALERDTIAGYRQFLAAYPHSDQARRVRAVLAVRREASYWRRAVAADTPRAYWTYLRVYPRGPHVADARRRLEMLSAEFEPPPDFRPEVFANLPPPPPDELFYDERPIYAFDDFGPPPPPPPPEYGYVEDDDWRDLPPPPPPPQIGVLPVLGIALPIAVGAVAFHGLSHHDGIAPRGVARWQAPPPAPPPLPANIKPVAPPPPARSAGRPVANAAVVKPLRPIGRRPLAPGAPAAAPAKPAGAAPRESRGDRASCRARPGAQAASRPACRGQISPRGASGCGGEASRRSARWRRRANRSRRSGGQAVARGAYAKRGQSRRRAIGAGRSQASGRGPRCWRSNSPRRQTLASAGGSRPGQAPRTRTGPRRSCLASGQTRAGAERRAEAFGANADPCRRSHAEAECGRETVSPGAVEARRRPAARGSRPRPAEGGCACCAAPGPAGGSRPRPGEGRCAASAANGGSPSCASSAAAGRSPGAGSTKGVRQAWPAALSEISADLGIACRLPFLAR